MTSQPLILRVATRVLYPLIVLASVWVLLRGHNAPGGGFIGGMMAVAATSLLAVAAGSDRAMARMPLRPVPLAASGVLAALVSGLPSLFLGQAYMTGIWGEALPFLPDLKPSTVLLFDIGVYFGVWGALGGFCAEVLAVEEPS